MAASISLNKLDLRLNLSFLGHLCPRLASRKLLIALKKVGHITQGDAEES